MVVLPLHEHVPLAGSRAVARTSPAPRALCPAPLTNSPPGHILKFVKMSKKPRADDSFFKAISDPTRRQILKLLKKRSMAAGEIAESFSITLGSLSHHFNVLKAADLVRCERRGQQIVYSLNTSVFEDAATMLAALFNLEKSR